MFYSLLRDTLLFRLDPETAHHIAYGALKEFGKFAKLTNQSRPKACSPKLIQYLMGETFVNPIGLAAGFDKNAYLGNALPSFGFGFCEVGSITASESKGNEKPRLFRLSKDNALINRMGLNNEGIEAILPRLQAWPQQFPLGINIAKTPGRVEQDALEDFATTYKNVMTLGTYHVLNISCPNTSDGKTYESPEGLEKLLKRIALEKKHCELGKARPLFIKVSADISLSQLDEMLEVAAKRDVTGWVATNTSKHTSLVENADIQQLLQIGDGGLSGEPIRDLSTALLGRIFYSTRNWKQPPLLIGVGGVSDTESAWQKIRHGASLVQLYSGWVYKGPCIAHDIQKGLIQKLEEHNLGNIALARGAAIVSTQKKSSS